METSATKPTPGVDLQKPSKGRVVLYNSSGEMCTALVLEAHEDGSVNLATWNPGGTYRFVSGAPKGSESGQWSWPPRV